MYGSKKAYEDFGKLPGGLPTCQFAGDGFDEVFDGDDADGFVVLDHDAHGCFVILQLSKRLTHWRFDIQHGGLLKHLHNRWAVIFAIHQRFMQTYHTQHGLSIAQNGITGYA